MKKTAFVLGIILITIVFIFWITRSEEMTQKSEKLQVVTTLFPLYDFVKNIGQDKVEVSLLLPPGVEAHSFEPKPSDIARINQADVFVFTGKFMEPWAEDIFRGVSNKHVRIVDSSVGIPLMSSGSLAADDHGIFLDPHIWLDFDNSKKIIQTLTIALSEKDPNNSPYYQKQAEEYQKKLDDLDQKYSSMLSDCAKDTIVYGGHFAFGYLANRYNLHYVAAQGISPDAEPTAQDLIQLVEQIKKDDIQYVFYEELSSPKIAQTLIDETNTQLLLLHAGHNVSKEDFERNISFLSIMEDNLVNLKKGLQCH